MKNVPSPLRRSCEQKNVRHLFQPFLHRCHPLYLCTCHHTIPHAATQVHCNHLMIRLLLTAKLSQSTPVIELLANTLLSSQLVSLPQEFNKILLKNLLIYSMRYKNRHITLSLQTITMNCAGLYFTRQDILEQPSTLELRRTVFHKAGHIGTAFYSSTIFQQSGTFYINSSPKDHERRGCQYIFQGYFTDLC